MGERAQTWTGQSYVLVMRQLIDQAQRNEQMYFCLECLFRNVFIEKIRDVIHYCEEQDRGVACLASVFCFWGLREAFAPWHLRLGLVPAEGHLITNTLESAKALMSSVTIISQCFLFAERDGKLPLESPFTVLYRGHLLFLSVPLLHFLLQSRCQGMHMFAHNRPR